MCFQPAGRLWAQKKSKAIWNVFTAVIIEAPVADTSRLSRLLFDGDEKYYELWET